MYPNDNGSIVARALVQDSSVRPPEVKNPKFCAEEVTPDEVPAILTAVLIKFPRAPCCFAVITKTPAPLFEAVTGQLALLLIAATMAGTIDEATTSPVAKPIVADPPETKMVTMPLPVAEVPPMVTV